MLRYRAILRLRTILAEQEDDQGDWQ
jgi:hypothetical protein